MIANLIPLLSGITIGIALGIMLMLRVLLAGALRTSGRQTRRKALEELPEAPEMWS